MSKRSSSPAPNSVRGNAKRPPTPPGGRPSTAAATGGRPLSARAPSATKRPDTPTGKRPLKSPVESGGRSPGPASKSASRSDEPDDESSPSERIRVFLRVREPTDEGPRQVSEASSEAWALDLAGGKEGVTAAIDGVVPPGAREDTMQAEAVDDLVDSVLGAGGAACGAILCYGPGGSGTSAAVFGNSRTGPGLVHRAVDKAGSYGPPAEVAISLIYVETVMDLIAGGSELSFSDGKHGIRLSGCRFEKVRSRASLDELLRAAFSTRERITAGIAQALRQLVHLVVSVRISSAPDAIVHVVELAPPPLVRVSGVAGLAVEDYCSLNTSLKTLERCVAAMAKRKKGGAPFRDSKLTRLLSAALGSDGGKVRCKG
ncbi:P-loop containing nucleoside triphosphate hydrolase protein, partial [Pavlovales sp. CCMP2436]